jgi:PBSX family phage terminase large subunit
VSAVAAERTLVVPRTFQPKQLDFLAACKDPDADEILFDGAIRAGKTQACCWQVFKWAIEFGGTYLILRATYPELRDSTRKVFVYGDSGLPATCPPELQADFNRTENVLKIRRPDGAEHAEVIFRAIQEHGLGKIRNVTLAGAFIDQLEELDEGPAGELLYQEIYGRLSDPRGPRKLLAAANPGPTTHWAYRRLVAKETRLPRTRRIHVTLHDNARFLPRDYISRMEAQREHLPHWYRSHVLGEWGSFEGAAYPEFSERVHVIDPFAIPQEWERFESLDFGQNNPTAAHAWAADYDGNLVVFGEYYSPGLVSKHAAEIRSRRGPRGADDGPLDGLNWWEADGGGTNVLWADPSIAARHGLTDRRGQPASVLTEFNEHGVSPALANNDRRAGYARLAELLHPEPGRIPPAWSRLDRSHGAAPRLFIFSSCPRLIEQLKNAPIKKEGPDAGEIVDPDWERQHGHAHASARYGAMSRPSPTERPEPWEPDPRVREQQRLVEEFEKRARRRGAAYELV